MTLLATKLLIPPARRHAVLRPRLRERLNTGLQRKLTLVSASAGFGKTTLLGDWLREGGHAAAWLSLDAGDNEPGRFLTYLVSALQAIAPSLGSGVLAALRSPQPPALEALLTLLLNELAAFDQSVLLVLDDLHVIVEPLLLEALSFVIEHLPPNGHLVIATREDPPLPLARLRVRDQLIELRAQDLRFTHAEAEAFLHQTMGLRLSSEHVTQLETRTEGWAAGLQLAALSLRGQADAEAFIGAFSGSHPFVWDYLFEEVLERQPETIQTFLLRTSILDRLCGSLCEAVLGEGDGDAMLAQLERANLFLVPLDHERRWYRYHHLFGELLRKRQSRGDLADLHRRASDWYASNGLDLDALHHAAAANDISRAARLVEGNGMPLHFRGAVAPVLSWLATLPPAELDARPSLWVNYASALLFVGRMGDVESRLKAAEAALLGKDADEAIRDLHGHIASIRATLAVGLGQPDVILQQSRLALEFLHPHNLPVRAATSWTLGHAYQRLGDREAAKQAYTEALAQSEALGHAVIILASSIGLGNLHEAENQFERATEIYRRVLQMAGDSPLPVVCEAHLGLARIACASNDLEGAAQHGQQGLHLARQLEYTDRAMACEALLAQVERARKGVSHQSLVEPLSEREREILGLIAQGCSNREIGDMLCLALDTVKGHNRRIFDKLQAQRRTEAVARARELNLL